MGKKVIELAKAAPDTALLGLNRLTGLSFSYWPESLVNPNLDGDSSEHGEMKARKPGTAAKRNDKREKRQA